MNGAPLGKESVSAASGRRWRSEFGEIGAQGPRVPVARSERASMLAAE